MENDKTEERATYTVSISLGDVQGDVLWTKLDTTDSSKTLSINTLSQDACCFLVQCGALIAPKSLIESRFPLTL